MFIINIYYFITYVGMKMFYKSIYGYIFMLELFKELEGVDTVTGSG